MSLPFLGEEMTCVICGKKERSRADVESNWRAVELGGRRFYACPTEFPPDTAPARQFEDAYVRLLKTILQKLQHDRAI